MDVKIFESGKTLSGSISVTTDSNYIPSLNGFRGISIILVVISHFFLNQKMGSFQSYRVISEY